MIELNLATLQDKLHTCVVHQRVCKTCFMNGKSCSYQREIEAALQEARKPPMGGKIPKAFVLMPFRTLLDQVYQTQLLPHLRYSCEQVSRADDITMTGFVVCEKICRQIQEATLIVAELTYDNPNVFYELGLAYALNKNIAVFVQKAFEKRREGILSKLAIPATSCNFYTPFAELKVPETRIWHVSSEEDRQPTPNAALRHPVVILLGDPTGVDEKLELTTGETNSAEYVTYSTNSICAGAIHMALSVAESKHAEDVAKRHPSQSSLTEVNADRVTIHLNNIDGAATHYTGGLRRAEGSSPLPIQSAKDIENYIRQARCVIVCASPRDPTGYFWMGFAHGLEKAVIPITVQQKKPKTRSDGDSRNRAAADGDASPGPLPFDVRALWHIHVTTEHIDRLQKQMTEIYQIILMKDRDILNRREFWDQVTGSGSVSVFVGSVEYIQAHRRHVVGEWDYRTVSEVISYLNSTKQNMETVIQTPIFQTSQRFQDNKNLKEAEIRRLDAMLSERGRNAIIVGSSDVNDMTDYVLARYAAVPFFDPSIRRHKGFRGIVAFKYEGDYETFATPSVYLERLPSNPDSPDGSPRERGFYDVSNGEPVCNIVNNKYASEIDIDPNKGYGCLHSHVAKFMIGHQWITVIQGISGPGTFGIAQLLTGARFRQFTAFGEVDTNSAVATQLRRLGKDEKDEFLSDFYRQEKNGDRIPNIEAYSEIMVGKLNDVFRHGKSVEAVVRVFISGTFPGTKADRQEDAHDERRVLWWQFALPPRVIIQPMLPPSLEPRHR